MKIQNIKVNNDILKTYELVYWTILNLKPSDSASYFNLKTIERDLEFIQINIEYCILITDMNSTIHNSFLFQYNNYKYKDKLINTIYTKIYKTIYDSKGNQKDNFKNDYVKDDLFGDYYPSPGVYLNIRKKSHSLLTFD